ncbi:hypothetical protein QTP70_015987 [Hemibagrus guttatus]|uniref:CD99 antigen n=1 Tax=Hemibagrus guttatus TaxID=175788 RepID=A0AAE0PZL3_9TELE|nr:hypothetical protein QTP70_015987 [Hemibagrus guttatus]
MTYYLWILLFGALVVIKAQELSLEDALDFGDDKATAKTGLDLEDALGPEPEKPKTEPQNDQPKAAEGGQMAGIISAVAVAVFGAASSYFAYQKKKLCFKVQGGTDPESGRNQSGTQSDPQVE